MTETGRPLIRCAASLRADYTGPGVILSQESQAVSLNRSARWIWELCDGSQTAEQITETLERRVGFPAGSLVAEVAATIDHLASLGFLRAQHERTGGHGAATKSATAADVAPSDGVDWSRLAEPQPDGYDTRVIQAYAARRDRAIVRSATRHRFFDGSIAIAWCYPDDIEPGLINAPLDHPSLDEAERYVGCWPVAYQQLRELIGTVHPLLDPRLPVGEGAFRHASQAYSAEALPGTLYSTVNCPVKLALNLVHEMAHQKLFELGVYLEGADRLVLNPPQQLYHSPFKSRRRPMMAILHGVFAFAHVMQLEIQILHSMGNRGLSPRQTALLVGRLERNMHRLEEGMSGLQRDAATDDAGRRFLTGLYRWVSRLEQDRHRLSTLSSRSC